ncbi:MAG: DHH family phosphoesterase [Thermoplasmata archaeon]|nr:DHH family phosphoesterase [Thermoplasmata archaeon]
MKSFQDFCLGFQNAIKNVKHGLVLTHCLADGDAAGSAIAIKLAFPVFEIGIPDSPTRTAKKIFTAMGVEYTVAPRLKDFDFVLVLDAAAPYMLGTLAGELKNAMVLDHHSYCNDWEQIPYFTDPGKNSTAEVVHAMLKEMGIQITPEIARAILLGIASDTAQFSIAKPGAFRTVAELLEHGLRIQDIFDVLNERNQDLSQRISVLKGFSRLKYQHYREFLVAGSVVSAHEAVVCTALVNAGVDIAFVGSQKEKEFRISGRLSNNAVKIGLSLTEIFSEVAEDIALESGGHPGAAGVSGTGDVEFVVNSCIEVSIRKIREKA